MRCNWVQFDSPYASHNWTRCMRTNPDSSEVISAQKSREMRRGRHIRKRNKGASDYCLFWAFPEDHWKSFRLLRDNSLPVFKVIITSKWRGSIVFSVSLAWAKNIDGRSHIIIGSRFARTLEACRIRRASQQEKEISWIYSLYNGNERTHTHTHRMCFIE